MFFFCRTVIALLGLMIGLCAALPVRAGSLPWSPVERDWLTEHAGSIRYGVLPTYPPVEYTAEGRHLGITADILIEIEQLLGVAFVRVPCRNWADLLEKASAGKVDLIGSIQDTPERRHRFSFTRPYVSLPNAIVGRDNLADDMQISDLAGLKVAVVKGYATVDYLRQHLPGAQLIELADELAALQEVSFGRVDAVVSDLAVASYYLEKFGIRNLKVAGYIDYTWQLSFAVRKDWPVLQQVMEKALVAVDPDRRQEIQQQWIPLETHGPTHLWWLLFGIVVVALLVLVGLVLVLAWNRALKREVAAKTIKLKESQRHYRELIDELPQPVFEVDQRGQITYINQAGYDWSGYAREDFTRGMLASQLFVEEDRPRMQTNMAALMRGEGELGNEYQVCKRDGSIAHVIAYSRPILIDGVPFGLRGLLVDVSSLKQTEAELLLTRSYLKHLINYMPSALLAVDDKGHVCLWNRRAEELSGVIAEQADGRSLPEVWPAMAVEAERLQRVLQPGAGEQRFRVTREVAGQRQRWELVAYPLQLPGLAHAVLRIDDVSERVALEEWMVQAEKMTSIGSLAAGMAHEINNPLAGMLQKAELVQARLALDSPRSQRTAREIGLSPERLHDLLQQLQVSPLLGDLLVTGRRAAHIVENMLSFSRKGEIRFQPTELRPLLQQTLELARTDFDLNRGGDSGVLPVELDLADDLPLFPCVPSQIQQVLLNLLQNAAEAVREVEQPEIIISARVAVGHLLLSVRDNGKGMDRATCKRIFEPFYTTRTGEGGSGLGLAVCYYIVVSHHRGELTVRSQPGEGAEFLLRLPLEQLGLEVEA